MPDISTESARVALREVETLIDSTHNAEPDPLQDDIFRARNELQQQLAVESDSPDCTDSSNPPTTTTD